MNELFARMQFAPISAASSGANEIIPGVSGKSIRVMNYTLIAASAVTATWKSATDAISGAMSLPATGGASPDCPLGVLRTAAGQALNLTLGGAVQVSGHMGYILE